MKDNVHLKLHRVWRLILPALMLTFLIQPFSAVAQVVGDDPDKKPVVVEKIPDQATPEDTPFELDVAPYFDDPDGDPLTFSASGLPNSLNISENGLISGTPGQDDIDIFSVRVTARDPRNGRARDQFNLEVVAVDDAPIITGQEVSPMVVDEDNVLTITPVDLIIVDPDSDTNGMSVDVLAGANYTVSGQNNILPTQDYSGGLVAPVRVTADGQVSNIFDVIIDVTPVNDPPTVITETPNQVATEDVEFALNLSANFTDIEGDALSFSATGLPGSLTMDGSGFISGVPLNEDVGQYSAVVTATDTSGAAASDSFTITVENTNDQPELTNPIGNQVAPEATLFSLDVSANFVDPDGEALGFSATGLPASLAISSVGLISGTPTQAEVGDYSIVVTATDGSSASVSDSFILTVDASNDAPQLVSPIADVTATEDSQFDFDVSNNFTDPDGDTLSFSASGLPTSLAMASDGTISGIPDQQDVGDHVITVIVADPAAASVSDDFILTVTGVNDPPEVVTPIGDRTTDEDSPFQLDLNNFFQDPDGDALVITASGVPPGLTLGPAGVLSGVPDQPDVGSHDIAVTATDSSDASVESGFVLTVTNVNDPPVVLAEIGDQTAVQAAEFQLDISGFFADQDDDALVFAASGLPPSLSISSQGLVSGQPEQADVGQYFVQVEATDPSSEKANQQFTLTVTDVNDPPELIAPIGDQAAPEDQLFSIDVSVNFEDPEGSMLVFTATGLPSSIVLETGGLMQGTPAQDDVGTYPVNVTATDPSGESVSDAFTLTVTGINDAPILVAPIGDQSATEDVSFVLDLASRFNDPDGDTLSYFATGLPGSLTLNQAGAISGTPVQSEVGDYTVSIEAQDPSGERATDSFALSVQAANDNPIFEGDIADQQAVEGEFFRIDVSVFFTDDDGDELTFAATGLPDSGNISINATNGVISGTPLQIDARDFPYQVTVTANDPDQASASGGFVLTVAAIDRANVSLDIEVTPSPAMLIDDTRWTFTARNSGPSAVQEQLLTGSFTGQQLEVQSLPPSNCELDAVAAARTTFSCSFGSLANGSTAFVVFSVSTNEVGDILARATTTASDEQPIDPNTSDNEAQQSVSVTESLSNGSVQALGESNAKSIAAGDLDGDGDLDLVVGTAAGQPVEVYDGSGYRTFAENPRIVAENSSTEGIALADLDDDGDLDMILANTGGQPDRVLGNDGSGNFEVLLELGDTDSRDVAAADFNGDGIVDLVFASVQGNPVYIGDGRGGFSLLVELGLESTFAVAAEDLTGDDRPDIIFANVGAPSTVWPNADGTGFSPPMELTIGDAISIAAFDLGNDGDTDLAFGRIPSTAADVPSNPVLANDGSGTMQVVHRLGASPTLDIQAADVNGDGLDDLVLVNATGTHQIWNATATGFELHEQQIVRPDSVAGLTADLGNDGGIDLALGGGTRAGVDTYLNDGNGNLGMGDAIPPTIELIGEASVSIAAGTTFTDPGAIAEDNIDGDLSALVQKQGFVNNQIVGTYTITYNVSDNAGNEAQPMSRKVTVTPAAGTGGGGGGAIGAEILVLMMLLFASFAYAGRRRSA